MPIKGLPAVTNASQPSEIEEVVHEDTDLLEAISKAQHTAGVDFTRTDRAVAEGKKTLGLIETARIERDGPKMPPEFRQFKLTPFLPDFDQQGQAWRHRAVHTLGGMMNDLGRSLAFSGTENYEIEKASGPDALDLTFGGELKSYLYTHHYEQNGVKKSVQVHLSIKWGDPKEPVTLCVGGLGTDSLHFFGHAIQDAKPKGTVVFFDPVGMGWSETPDDRDAHKLDVSAQALIGALSKLNLDPNISLVQSYGYGFWLYLVMNGYLTESSVIDYGTGPDQRPLQAMMAMRHLPGGTLGLDAMEKMPLAMSKLDFIRMYELILGEGVSPQYLDAFASQIIKTGKDPDTGLERDRLRSFFWLWSEPVRDYDGNLFGMASKLPQLSYDDKTVPAGHVVHLVAGEKDHGFPEKVLARHKANLDQNPLFTTDLQVAPGAGHLGVSVASSRHMMADLIQQEIERFRPLKLAGHGHLRVPPVTVKEG